MPVYVAVFAQSGPALRMRVPGVTEWRMACAVEVICDRSDA